MSVKALKALHALLAAEGGGVIVEYALIVSLLSLAAIGALIGIGAAATIELGTEGNALTAAGENPP
jgi:Flp pilus assembly pilin Flp